MLSEIHKNFIVHYNSQNFTKFHSSLQFTEFQTYSLIAIPSTRSISSTNQSHFSINLELEQAKLAQFLETTSLEKKETVIQTGGKMAAAGMLKV